MPPDKKDPTISAVEAVHNALKPLSPEDRQRVVASVNALLQIAPPTDTPSMPAGQQRDAAVAAGPSGPSRPLAIRELIESKSPRTHAQFITLFAYYREKSQNLPTFSRGQLEQYYTMAREKPPTNYDRDFVETIKRGWIHEDGENSYITSKGIEAVESGFADDVRGKRKPHPAKKKAKSNKSAKRS